MTANNVEEQVYTPAHETQSRSRPDERFIINLKGKDFVTCAGLLDLAHQHGLERLVVEAIQFPSKGRGRWPGSHVLQGLPASIQHERLPCTILQRMIRNGLNKL